MDGTEITSMSESRMARFRRAKIGYIFQSFHLIPTLTALENVLVPLELTGHAAAKEQAIEILKEVGLGNRVDHYPVQLSGGEQQRVAVARAFACRPPILLADEPTGNLDSAMGEQVLDVFTALHGRGKTVLMVTHNRAILRRATRTVRLCDGRVDGDERLAVSGRAL